MKIDRAVAFLNEHHRAVLSTVKANGRPQLSPIVACARDDGAVLISTRARSAKVKNITRRPAVSLCVMNDQFFGRWMQIDGTATVIGLPEAMDGLVDYYRRVAGEHPDWSEYREAMVREERVLLLIDVVAVGPNLES